MDNKSMVDKFMKEHPNTWYSKKEICNAIGIERPRVANSLKRL